MIKRVFLFVLTNLLVMLTISIVVSLLGVWPALNQAGIDYASLMTFCLIWGFGGAFISLLMSRWVAKMTMGIRLIQPGSGSSTDALYNMVEQIAKAAGLPRTPEVGIYDSPEVNAFATGPSKNRALIAFSSGILSTMNREQIEGVAGHEIAHIANGDMVTMTLLQGVINSFVLFFAKVIAFAVSQSVREESQYTVRWLVDIVLQILLTILGSIIVMWFSRQREFRADRGSAKVVGRERMVAALRGLQRYVEYAQADEGAAGLSTLKISTQPASGFRALFMSHPPLEASIEALQRMG